MQFRIWNTETGNLVGEFMTAERAARVIRESAASYGLGYVLTWAVESEGDDGSIVVLGEDRSLAEWAGVPIPEITRPGQAS